MTIKDRHEQWKQLSEERGFEDPNSVKVNHPDFLYVRNGGVSAYPVLIFERSRRKPISKEEEQQWYHNRDIVEAHGGYMRRDVTQLGEANPPFTEEDCHEIRAAVQRDLPEWEIRDWWNGVGAYSFSVSVGRKNRHG